MPTVGHGVLVVDKPRGITSHDAVARVRRAIGTREVGHAGTLDPMASGVLVLAVGEATKLVPWLTAQDKAYEATIALGVETDTLDAQGRPVREAPPSPDLLKALAKYRGGTMLLPPVLARAFALERARTSQVPPAYSAIKLEGKRAYAMARRGEQPALAARDVHVRRLELSACSAEPPTLEIALEVGKGYYVRALARDLSAELGTVGHLTTLRRTRSGCFQCTEAAPLELPSQELVARLHPLAHAATLVLPGAAVTASGAREARHGRLVPASDIDAPAAGPSAWIDPSGALVAVGALDESGRGKVLRGFSSARD
jgi:tRNA pseudouridine55 synthase